MSGEHKNFAPKNWKSQKLQKEKNRGKQYKLEITDCFLKSKTLVSKGLRYFILLLFCPILVHPALEWKAKINKGKHKCRSRKENVEQSRIHKGEPYLMYVWRQHRACNWFQIREVLLLLAEPTHTLERMSAPYYFNSFVSSSFSPSSNPLFQTQLLTDGPSSQSKRRGMVWKPSWRYDLATTHLIRQVNLWGGSFMGKCERIDIVFSPTWCSFRLNLGPQTPFFQCWSVSEWVREKVCAPSSNLETDSWIQMDLCWGVQGWLEGGSCLWVPTCLPTYLPPSSVQPRRGPLKERTPPVPYSSLILSIHISHRSPTHSHSTNFKRVWCLFRLFIRIRILWCEYIQEGGGEGYVCWCCCVKGDHGTGLWIHWRREDLDSVAIPSDLSLSVVENECCRSFFHLGIWVCDFAAPSASLIVYFVFFCFCCVSMCV